MSINLAGVRLRVETDLDDVTLQLILDRAVQAIERSAGKASSETETFSDARGAQFIALVRRSTSITSITERATLSTDPAVTLSTDDWRMVGDYKILRLSTGTNSRSRWGREIVVAYVPEIDADLRDSVTLDLVQMIVEFRALDKEKVGDWSGEQTDYQKRRKALLATVREGRSPVL